MARSVEPLASLKGKKGKGSAGKLSPAPMSPQVPKKHDGPVKPDEVSAEERETNIEAYEAVAAVVQELEEPQDVAQECMESIWDGVATTIVEKDMKLRTIPYAVERTLVDMFEVFSMLSMKTAGPVHLPDQLLEPSLPQSVPNDSWARGVVESAASSSLETVPCADEMTPLPGLEKHRRSSSRSSVRSQRSHGSRRAAGWRSSSVPGTPNTASKSVQKRVFMLDPKDAMDGRRKWGQKSGASDLVNAAALHRSNTKAKTFSMAVKEEENEERQFLNQLVKETRGKGQQYLYDRDGRVVLLKKWKADALPAVDVPTKVNVRGNRPATDNSKRGGRLPPVRSSTQPRKQKKPQRSGSVAIERAIVEAEIQQQVVPAGVSKVPQPASKSMQQREGVRSTTVNHAEMALKAGVTFKEGQLIKRGAEDRSGIHHAKHSGDIGDAGKRLTLSTYQERRNAGILPLSDAATMKLQNLNIRHSIREGTPDTQAKNTSIGDISSIPLRPISQPHESEPIQQSMPSMVMPRSVHMVSARSAKDTAHRVKISNYKTVLDDIPKSPARVSSSNDDRIVANTRERPKWAAQSYTEAGSEPAPVGVAGVPGSMSNRSSARRQHLPPPLQPATMGHGFFSEITSPTSARMQDHTLHDNSSSTGRPVPPPGMYRYEREFRGSSVPDKVRSTRLAHQLL